MTCLRNLLKPNIAEYHKTEFIYHHMFINSIAFNTGFPIWSSIKTMWNIIALSAFEDFMSIYKNVLTMWKIIGTRRT